MLQSGRVKVPELRVLSAASKHEENGKKKLDNSTEKFTLFIEYASFHFVKKRVFDEKSLYPII